MEKDLRLEKARRNGLRTEFNTLWEDYAAGAHGTIDAQEVTIID